MGGFWDFVDSLTGYIWAMPMIVLILGSVLYFSIRMGFMQIRLIPEMVRLLFSGKASKEGLSSFQSFTLAIAGRVGTGNIAGVATAICMGGPGALFWMWITAIFGSSASFIECSLSQLHKKNINGEYRGGYNYYIGDRFGKGLGIFTCILMTLTLAFTQTGVHVGNIASAAENAFGAPRIGTAIVVSILLALIIFGGVKRIAHVAELIVPIMSVVYVLVAIVVVCINFREIPHAFYVIFTSAFGKNQIIGGAMGSAIIWGVKRAVFSSETGQATSTFSAAAANVSHPAKQGLVQTFSIYIDTLFVCTATGLMLVLTNHYNVVDEAGNMLYMGLGEAIEVGPIWVQEALSSVFPWGSQFVAIALFFFAFTTVLNHTYSCTAAFSYLFQDKKNEHKTAITDKIIYIVFILGAIYAGIVTTSAAWALGDTGLGLVVWINYLSILALSGTAFKLLKDYEEQKKAGLDPVFDPDKFADQKGFGFDLTLWCDIRDKFRIGELKN